MRFDPTDLNAVVRELAALTGAAVAARSVRLELALAADLPKVLADRAQLSQVFVNLLTNALDAMPAGGRIRIETRRGTLGDGARPDGRAGRKVAGLPAEPAEPGGEPAVAVEFYDSGVGIAPDDVKRVFEPFYSTKALGHGTGLGLAICHQVVKRHSGTITVTSEPGKGSTFLVLLPRPTTGGTRA
jgi:signal transduction histidine kinase